MDEDGDGADAMVRDCLDRYPLLSDMAQEWCISELRNKAHQFAETGYVTAFDSASQICKTDAAVSLDLLGCITKGISHLEATEDIPYSRWGYVRMLVNPSAFPLVYGTSPVLINGNKTTLEDELVPTLRNLVPFPAQDKVIFKDENVAEQTNTEYQRLPCEVLFVDIRR